MIRSNQHGMTAVEAVMALDIPLSIAGIALPGFSTMAQRHRLEASAAELETAVNFARSSAVLKHRNVRLSVQTHAFGSCYLVHTGNAASCTCSATGATSCDAASEVLMSRSLNDGAPQISSNSPSIVFNAEHGTVTPTASMTLTAKNGQALRLVVSLMGRVRTCTPNATQGHKPCP